MADLSTKNEQLLKGSEVFVPMTQDAGFIVSIPQGAKVTLSKDQGAFSMYTEDPDGPQATMKASTKAEIEADPERAMHMQTVKGLESEGAEMTIHRHEGGMTAVASNDAKLSQGVTSITEQQVQQALEQNAPAHKVSAFKPG